MPRKIAVSTLNASTVDILNTIRANASQEYQNLVPEITKADEIPRVGEVVMGYPGLANQFLSALMNRIAAVRVKSATFNNAYAQFKKGYLEFGETVEEVFVNICKAREFSAEKADARELKRSVPDVRTAMHIMNWRVQYPLTIQHRDLERAFLSADGVTDLIARLVGSLSTAAEYDEYLLFKYLIIKGVNAGAMYPVNIAPPPIIGASVSPTILATAFRGVSNTLPFMSNKYNAAGVTTNTNKDAQLIIMDAHFNAEFDVNVLASAFNMDKANFMGKLMLMDDFTTFDNERFDVIRANSDMIEEVTAAELARMQTVRAIILDSEWFQVYDNLQQMSETQVASGLYWNYFLNVWKTVSYSPFSNAVVFVAPSAPTGTIDITVDTVSTDDQGRRVITFTSEHDNLVFEQTESLTRLGIAMHKYGALVFPAGTNTVDTVPIRVFMGGQAYAANPAYGDILAPGDSVTLPTDQT